MTVTSDNTTGAELAESLLKEVSGERTRAATRLLGAHSDGYWLRRFLEGESELMIADRSVIDRSGPHPSVDWDTVGLLGLSRPSAFSSSPSEMAVLEVAASLVNRCGVQLGKLTEVLDDPEFRLILRALEEARGTG
ncbi:hypothetical protein ACIHFE_30850 [Streptomyces sp. NPDC052396]|uniref:hypothetical protein n=1 Tax=Streptomyces sp. NPDC052396 TaxID=3365689 RepID=UPI0037D781A3